MEREWKANVEISPSCPRCGSTNTKFCYYNNYSLTQPRYFCKGCRRYWTKGGSLRNVPVGGGCRKNRRGKSLKLSTDVHSKSLGYGGMPNDPIRHPYDHSVESSSSSITPDGSHIDLALVYANFLNPQPDSKTSGFEMPELPGEFDPSPEFTTISNTNLESSLQLLEENGLVGCLTISDLSAEAPVSENDHLMYYCGLDSTHKHHDRTQQCTSHDTGNYGLPPLPGEEVASQEILWSNSHMMDNRTLQGTQQPVDTQDPSLLFGNWSPFDLSGDDTFSRT